MRANILKSRQQVCVPVSTKVNEISSQDILQTYRDDPSDKKQHQAITPVLLIDHNTTAPDEVVHHKDTSSQTTAIEDKDVKPMYGDEQSVAAMVKKQLMEILPTLLHNQTSIRYKRRKRKNH